MLTPIAVANPGALGDSPALSDAYQSLPKVNDFSFLTPLGLSPELASQMGFHHTGRILAENMHALVHLGHT